MRGKFVRKQARGTRCDWETRKGNTKNRKTKIGKEKKNGQNRIRAIRIQKTRKQVRKEKGKRMVKEQWGWWFYQLIFLKWHVLLVHPAGEFGPLVREN
jgi:hypothetical protein